MDLELADLLEPCPECAHRRKQNPPVDVQPGSALSKFGHGPETEYSPVGVCPSCKGDGWIAKPGAGQVLIEFIKKTRKQCQQS
jgi:hypothetical protein